MKISKIKKALLSSVSVLILFLTVIFACTGLHAQVIVRGDMNNDANVNIDDAIYLLRHTLMSSRYKITQSGDLNGDGTVNVDDAIYLLRHTLMPSRYPFACEHALVTDEEVYPTCTETGLTEGKHCSVCGKVTVPQKVVPATGHSFGEWHTVTAGGCSDTEYSVRVCEKCMYVETDGQGITHPHDFEITYTKPTCTSSGKVTVKCKKCGIIAANEVLPSLGHDLRWNITAENHFMECVRAYCDYKTETKAHTADTESPCMDAYCKECGYFMREGIGHIMSSAYSSDETGHWLGCTRSGCDYKKDYGVHKNKSATCANKTAECDTCKKEFEPKESHCIESVGAVRPNDCTKPGYYIKKCTNCDYSIKIIIPGKEHTMSKWTVTKAPTETENGEEYRTCTVCGEYSETRVIAATGHKLGDWYVTEEAGCLTTGTKRRDCSHCDYFETRKTAAKGHYCTKWTEIKAPTCMEDGEYYGYCVHCGEYFTKTVAATGHDWDKTFLHDEVHHWQNCKDCSAKMAWGAHAGGENTCTAAAKCFYCGYEYGKALGHDFETEYSFEGNKHFYKCKNGCGLKKDEAVHTMVAKSETTEHTDDGTQKKYVHKLYMVCSECGYHDEAYTLIKSEHYACIVLKGYAPTCTTAGRTWGLKCGVAGCGEIYQAQEEIPALGHDYKNGVCVRCGAGGSGTNPPAGSHTCVGVAWIMTKNPTCTEAGERHFVCSCGAVLKKENVPARGHTIVGDKGKVPTCTEKGLTDGSHCSYCGLVITAQTELPAKGHNFVDGVCKNCGKKEAGAGLVFTLNSDGKSYSVTGIGTCTDTDIIIPATYNGLPVTGIGKSAFYQCESITSIEIPDSVTSIGEGAFGGCMGLTNVTIGNGVTSIGIYAFGGCIGLKNITIPNNVASIGNLAFSGCTGLTSITVEIGNTKYHSAGNCIIETESKTLIVGCKNSVIPADGSVTSIGKLSFANCTSLASITIPNSITSIGYGAFSGCTGLTNVTVPDSVTSIGGYAFGGCDGLTSITIPFVGENKDGSGIMRFEHIFGATDYNADGNRIPNALKTVIITGGTKIGASAFYGCKGIVSITIPNSITSVGDRAFAGCSSLTSIVIPNGVTSMGAGVFSRCTSLTSITIPDSVTSIGKEAFYNCSSLTSISLPDGVMSIGNGAFFNCKALTSITIPSNVTSIGKETFCYCTSLASITIPNSVTSIGEQAFGSCTALTSITIPNSVTSIGSSAFSYCKCLISITIPDSVISIGNGAFFETDLATMTVEIGNKVYHSAGNCIIETESKTLIAGCKNSTIPTDGSVTSIGDGAFSGRSGLTSIAIPNSVSIIDHGAFAHCASLTNITIPSSVTSIGSYAFNNCTSLETITFKGAEEQWNAITKGTNWDHDAGCFTAKGKYTLVFATETKKYSEGLAFTLNSDGKSYSVTGIGTCTDTDIIIPATYNGLPVTAIGKQAFCGCMGLTSITIPNSVTSIGERAFDSCIALTSIAIPDSVTSIGYAAFCSCTSLTNITIPNSVTSIGYQAFSNCTGFTTIIIPSSVTNIGAGAFSGCSGLESITVESGNATYYSKDNCIIKSATKALIVGCKNSVIPTDGSVTSIGDYAFSSCKGLTSITIPNSVTSIGNEAFCGCEGLTSIIIPDSVTSIGNGAFSSCEGLTSITIPDRVTSIGDHAFHGCTRLKSITMPDGVTSIGDGAFYGCRALTSIMIPSNVTSIGNSAFYGCAELASITIPNSVTNIDIYAFYYCWYLETITFKGTETQWNAITKGKYWDKSAGSSTAAGKYTLVFAPEAEYSEGLAFTLNSDGKSYSVTGIGTCTDTEIIIPATYNGLPVTEIGDRAFSTQNGITSVEIPDSVTRIGENAFYGCTGLTSVMIPDSVKWIRFDAFYNCTSLSSVYITDIAKWCEISFNYSSANPFYYAQNLYLDGQLVTNLIIPDSVTSIGKYAFSGCTSLTSITIPNSVTSIGEYAFYECASLESIAVESGNTKYHSAGNCLIETESKTLIVGCNNSVIPSDGSVTSIGGGAFCYRTGLTSITIPNNVTSIGNDAFYGCTSLASITMPDSVTSIGDNTVYNTAYYNDEGNWTDGVLYIGNHLIKANSKKLTKNYTVKACTKCIAGSAFSYCKSLVSITISDSVTNIGNDAINSERDFQKTQQKTPNNIENSLQMIA